MRALWTGVLAALTGVAPAQSLYFPPTGPSWETMDPVATLNWCPDRVAELQQFLGEKDTKGFIILKDGRIAVEWYYGTFTGDSMWYWASAGKTMTAVLAGLAQQEGLLDIDEPSHHYLGTGWSSCTGQEEEAITIRHHLTMTTGLDDKFAQDPDCTDAECLACLAEPGTRWAYHNAAYTLLETVVSTAAGMPINMYFQSRLGSRIGATGLYLPLGYNRVFFSRTRDMARFGLLVLAEGIWNADTIFTDTAYFRQMVRRSQDLNPSYGYLWWLNGQGTYMLPGLPFQIPGNLIAQAPEDLVAGLGKNDQKVYVVPSEGMVVVRLGETAGGVNPTLSGFDNQLWERIMALPCASAKEPQSGQEDWRVLPNPASTGWILEGGADPVSWTLTDLHGRLVRQGHDRWLDASLLGEGMYFLRIKAPGRMPVTLRLVRSGTGE